jgi:tRNA threonylcarbamoyladenosine biosynthesis protein TsaB
MLLVALETSSDVCSVAVTDDQGLLAERAFRHSMHLLERLVPELDAILVSAGLSIRRVEAFGVGVGPGSLTGVRVGVTTIKALADALSIPVCGVSTLDALASDHCGMQGTVIAPMVRARYGTVFTQAYRPARGQVEGLCHPAALEVSAALAYIATQAPGPYLVCGDGLVRHQEELGEAAVALGLRVQFGRPDPPRASSVARIARARLRAGASDDALRLAPLYVSEPIIGPPAKPRG